MQVSDELRNLLYAREAGAVKRLHTQVYNGHYDIAQHTFNMLTMLLCLYPDCSKNLMTAIIQHDLAERLTGDMPAPVKWVDPSIKDSLDALEKSILEFYGFPEVELTEEEHKWLKSLDIFELYLFAKYHYARDESPSMKNMMIRIVQRVKDYPNSFVSKVRLHMLNFDYVMSQGAKYGYTIPELGDQTCQIKI